ncbi:zinc-binding protein A33-like [Hypanus sabinus]|uniref:zinc-binding protein A33-like n=1 Tax=Hypanus sabinus TaxID=79690 RepID=UPI0028C3C131|nr:zinc-binding protein A33-like [Hypanus sabinus]
MAKQQVQSLTDEVTCRICDNFFTDPIILECGHNFCRRCITWRWETEERNSCPQCHRVFADRTLRVNPALGSLAQKAQGLNLILKEKDKKFYCEEHHEELKLFCETDKKLICVICASAQEHKAHNYLPIKEAAENYKNRVTLFLESLANRKSDIQRMAEQQKEKISGVLVQSQSMQAHVRSLFADLRQMLTEREQRLLSELRADEQRILDPMEKNLRDIEESLSSLQQRLSMLQERINQQDNTTFLKEEFSRKRRYSEEERVLTVLDGTLPVKTFGLASLINAMLSEAFHFIRQVAVTLDVETANPRLEVSDDRKSVKYTPSPRSLHYSVKRFADQACVLGLVGFTSGRHYWEVEVAANRRWTLGVAAESVSRKGLGRLRPENGVWSIARKNHKVHINNTVPIPLLAEPFLRKVGVYLSYETGTVSFYSVDTKSHLHTFTGIKFSGKVYPFLRTVDGNWLRISSGSAPRL